jgi:hypothetical protein
MKRVFQLIALATLAFSAVACSGGSDSSDTPPVVKIGVDDASKLKKAPKPADTTKPETTPAKPGDTKPADTTKPADAPKKP